MQLRHLFYLGLMCLLGASSYAQASSQTQSLGASSSVVNTCAIDSTDLISFGNYLPSSGLAPQASGQIRLRCTKGASVSVLPSSGGTQMFGPSGVLTYALYLDSGLSQLWGSSSYTYDTFNFSTVTSLYADYQGSGYTLNGCASLANGRMFSWSQQNTAGGYCFTNFTSTVSAHGSSLFSQANTRPLYTYSTSPTIVSNSNNINTLAGFYLPDSTTTHVSSLTYKVVTGISGSGQALTGLSSSVQTPVVLTYYGRVPSGQDVVPGTYTDTVTV